MRRDAKLEIKWNLNRDKQLPSYSEQMWVPIYCKRWVPLKMKYLRVRYMRETIVSKLLEESELFTGKVKKVQYISTYYILSDDPTRKTR